MSKSRWDTCRLGAQLPSIIGLVSAEAQERFQHLQIALSSVAYRTSFPSGPTDRASTGDGSFIGRLVLGLLSRGWPTNSSPAVEDSLLSTIQPDARLERIATSDSSRLAWELTPLAENSELTDWNDIILGALLKADCRLLIDETEISLLVDSDAELHFYQKVLAPTFGNAIGWIELQRPIASMVSEDLSPPNQDLSGRVDFAIELPSSRGPLKVAIELDGPHHKQPEQRKADNTRDRLLQKNSWTIHRIPLEEWRSGNTLHLRSRLNAIRDKNQFPFSISEGYSELHSGTQHREASRLLLTPHAVARVQFGLTRALMDGILSLNDGNWTLAITERDVPCAELALRDWLQVVTQMCHVYGVPFGTKRIHLFVASDHVDQFASPEWNGSFGSDPRVTVSALADAASDRVIDLAIDVSVGANTTRRYPLDPLSVSQLHVRSKVELRTAQRQSGHRTETWPTPRVISEPAQKRDSLEYFLRYLFRKVTFRPGQFEIIERVLRRQDVIGLLPTGAGKSITFQLPALLSPGLTLVIDPLKSLMQDQVENLRSYGIMDAIQINSDTSPVERSQIERQFSAGEYRLVFISPERLQVQDFRDRLRATVNQRSVSYFVVDETHCLSEWGHDFRTAYLNLGRIARDHCSHSGERPPVVALTGTASESVLRDVQRELDIEKQEAIIRPSDFHRPELKFEIQRVPKSQKLGKLLSLLDQEIPHWLGLTRDQLASKDCGGLVFCPHVNGKLGVFYIAQEISRYLPQFALAQGTPNEPLVGYYSGEQPKKLEMSNNLWSQHKARMQSAFKTGSTSLLVATKAFGMGIDKANIRYTIHYSMSQSIEAFSQEAGRAGRDREDAICAVLFTDRLSSKNDRRTAPDCLELGISVEEANKRANDAGQDSDDAELQMFLHSRSYPGVERESALVRRFYHTFIERLAGGEASSTFGTFSVTVSDSDVRAFEEPDEALYSGNPHPESGSNWETERDRTKNFTPDVQRIIYRLSLVGLIQDYTILYQPGNNIYTIAALPFSASGVQANLFAYVRRYRTSDRIKSVEARLADSPIEGVVDKVIDTLCWFIYEEIEQRRRQAISNMRQLLRDSSDGDDLSRRINEFLSNSVLTRTIFDALAADDFEKWTSVASQITSTESAEHVYYQCGRALEDAPGHPGLILLQAIALLGSDSERASEAVSPLQFGLSQARQVFSEDEFRAIVVWVVTELSRMAPVASFKVLNDLMLESSDPELPKAVLGLIASGALPGDPLVSRTASRRLLARIDSRIETFVGS